MEKTVREIIKETSRDHIKKNNSLIFGQCLSAVGWVGGTVPELTEKVSRWWRNEFGWSSVAIISLSSVSF